MDPVYSFLPGTSPLLVSIPHAGTGIPPAIAARMTGHAQQLPDTDWYVDRLYGWLTARDAGLLVANYSRYVIDLNRPPDDAALYAAGGPGLAPVRTFDGRALYQPGMEPCEREVARRLTEYWLPYHQKLAGELQRLRRQFGFAILLDAHSIRSRVPKLFPDRLPDLNLGSFDGASAAAGLVAASMAALERHSGWSLALDGRFKGGYITRHHGRPQNGIHALQLEMAQSVYMNEQPPAYDSVRAAKVMPVLRDLIDAILQWRAFDE